MGKLVKVQVKLLKENDFEWSHLCYVPRDIRDKFERDVNIHRFIINYWVSLWAMNEFGIPAVDTEEDLLTLKESIKLKYEKLYPDIFLRSNTDRQGWMRLWVVENMRMELRRIGK